MRLARKNIMNLEPYPPGKPIEELQREMGIKDIIKLASNENPLGPSPKAVKALANSLKKINRYPDGSCFYLKRKLSKKLKLKPENIIFGNGSDELIDIITKAFLNENEEAIVAEPSFLEYRITIKIKGAKAVFVPMKDFNYDIDGILKSISNRTKLILLGNPDNPTGAYFTEDDLRKFLKACPKHVIIVFDEAYRELVTKKDYANPIKYINRFNIIILRTFSKAYGLAGLRIGYAISNKNLIGWMNRVRQPFNVNLLAQVAALAALDDQRFIKESKKVISEGKRFLVKNLKALGFKVVESPANYMLVYCGKNKGGLFSKKMLARGVIIRDMWPYRLPNYFRVNVGTMQENRRFIKELKRLSV